MATLIQRSIEIIKANQFPSGAYVASPNFKSYHYCWFRDGSFTAYAMDLYGETESARQYHDWAARAVLARADVVQRAVEEIKAGKPLSPQNNLHTRYTLEGKDGVIDEWPNHQLDGFGTWLWSLEQHAHLSGRPLPADWLQAAGLVGQYLAALWNRPCYDCWEEFPDQVHTYTLGAIYAGVKALASFGKADVQDWLNEIRKAVQTRMVYKDHLVKYPGTYTVDASLIALAVPYSLYSPGDAIISATVERIESTLVHGGGVRRYATDTYYGGGEWVLLTAWLGWYYATVGKTDKARAALQWIEAQADAEGNLPEQVPISLVDPNYYQPWVDSWGTIATPLLWSHAKYLILNAAIAGKIKAE